MQTWIEWFNKHSNYNAYTSDLTLWGPWWVSSRLGSLQTWNKGTSSLGAVHFLWEQNSLSHHLFSSPCLLSVPKSLILYPHLCMYLCVYVLTLSLSGRVVLESEVCGSSLCDKYVVTSAIANSELQVIASIYLLGLRSCSYFGPHFSDMVSNWLTKDTNW